MSIEAIKLALEALKKEQDIYLEYDPEDGAPEYIYEAITALEFALAKQWQGEPVGDLAEYVIGCFRAAEVEGLQEALTETKDERLKDLVERRLMYALYKAQEPQPKQEQGEPLDLMTAVEYADARWAGVDVPVEWAEHFAHGVGLVPESVRERFVRALIKHLDLAAPPAQPEQELVATVYASRAERDLYEQEDEDDTTLQQRNPQDCGHESCDCRSYCKHGIEPQQRKPLRGILSVGYAGGRVVTCSFKTQADAKDFGRYALQAAHNIKGEV